MAESDRAFMIRRLKDLASVLDGKHVSSEPAYRFLRVSDALLVREAAEAFEALEAATIVHTCKPDEICRCNVGA